MSSKKHYTDVEKKFFLRMLAKYSHVIERKKSDATTLKDKEEAWNEVCDSYNISSIITSKRSVQQLKKLWSNLKSTQRDAVTREKQSRLSTGSRSEPAPAEIDPDIAAIAPNLMTTAPTLFSSNFSNKILQERQQRILNDDCIPEELIIENDDHELLVDDNFPEITNDSCTQLSIVVDTAKTKESSSGIDDVEKENNPLLSANSAIYSNNYEVITPKNKIQKSQLESGENTDEKSLKVKRIKYLINHEQQIASLKIQHQEAIQKLEIDHLKEKYSLKIRATTAATELSEFLLQEKKNKNG